MDQEQNIEGDKYDNKSSVLALRIIEILSSCAEPLALTSLARQLGTNKWKVSRHLHALRKEGFVIQDSSTNRFEPGLRLFAIGVSLSNRKTLVLECKAAMLALQAKVRLPVSLVGLVQDKAIVLDGVSENEPLAVVTGISLELHSSAHGKIALAFGPEHLLEQLLLKPLFVHNDLTITDPGRLREEIAKVRKRGWSTSLEERKKGLTSVAAPILSPNQTYMGSLGILYFGKAKPSSAQIRELLRATRSITNQIAASATHDATPSERKSVKKDGQAQRNRATPSGEKKPSTRQARQ